MATLQKFIELQVWQLAHELSQKTYSLTFFELIAKGEVAELKLQVYRGLID
jgi:hypothetical protein